MFSVLRWRAGVPTILGVLLILSLSIGGAYAASDSGLSPKAKKQVKAIATAIAKKFQGTGPAGPQGPAGAAGKNGAPGTAGVDGKSVVVSNTAPGCTAGGVTVEVEGSGVENEICNGENGQTGFTETLPSKKTETGAYRNSTAAGSVISFNIPLPAELDEAHTKIVTKAQIQGSTIPAQCENSEHPGAASPANPEAAPGYLCVFSPTESHPLGVAKLTNNSFETLIPGAGTTGALLAFFTPTSEGNGTWAVTAP